MTKKGFNGNDNKRYLTNYERDKLKEKRKKNNGKQVELV